VKIEMPRWVLRLYPADWRNRYGEELADLFEEMVRRRESTRLCLILGLLRGAFVERARSLYRGRRTMVVSTLALIVAATVFLTVGGVTSLPSAGRLPTKGNLPQNYAVSPNGSIDYKTIPDFISVTKNHKTVGYVPSRDVFGIANAPDGGGLRIVPVYASDLKTLVGHVYPFEGFVPLGKEPATCSPEKAPRCPTVLINVSDTDK
jgi:hypothetical protein